KSGKLRVFSETYSSRATLKQKRSGEATANKSMGQVRNFEARIFRALHREPPQSKVHRPAFWLLIIYLGLIPERLLPGNAGGFFQWVSFFILLLLLAFCIPLVWRW